MPCGMVRRIGAIASDEAEREGMICIDRAHADNSIKREIVRDPGRFIVRDPLLPSTLAYMSTRT